MENTNVFTCLRCGFYTPHKNVLVAHLTKVKECPCKNSDAPRQLLIEEMRKQSKRTQKTEQGLYPCIKCGKEYKSAASKHNHQRTCKGDKHQILFDRMSVFENTIEQMQNTIDELQEKLAVYQHGSNNYTNCNIQNQNIIIINNFGEETIDHITHDTWLKYLYNCQDRGYLANGAEHGIVSLQKVIRNVEPNDNIRYHDKKHCAVKSNASWVKKDVTEVAKTCMQNTAAVSLEHLRKNMHVYEKIEPYIGICDEIEEHLEKCKHNVDPDECIPIINEIAKQLKQLKMKRMTPAL